MTDPTTPPLLDDPQFRRRRRIVVALCQPCAAAAVGHPELGVGADPDLTPLGMIDLHTRALTPVMDYHRPDKPVVSPYTTITGWCDGCGSMGAFLRHKRVHSFIVSDRTDLDDPTNVCVDCDGSGHETFEGAKTGEWNQCTSCGGSGKVRE